MAKQTYSANQVLPFYAVPIFEFTEAEYSLIEGSVAMLALRLGASSGNLSFPISVNVSTLDGGGSTRKSSEL